MNKVFKVIWSKAKSAWIVVSELAKNHDAKVGIHDGRKRYAWLTQAVMLALVLGNNTAWATTTSTDYGIFSQGLTIGDSKDVTKGFLTSYSPSAFWGPVTFYNDVTFSKGFSFSDLVVNGMHIDYNNTSHSFSLGQTYHKDNTSNYMISLGETFNAGDYSFVAGNQAQGGKYSVVIGSSANGNNPYTVVLGPNTQAASSSIVLGNHAMTYRNNGIAIGAAAVDDSGNVTTKGALAGDTYSIAIGTGSETNQGGNGNIAIGYMAQNTSGSDAIALGAFSKSDWRLNAGQRGYAPWEGSNTGNVDNSNFKNSLASAVWKSTKGGLSIGDITGDKSAWITRQISGVAAGTQDTDAVNVAQLKASMTTLSSTDGSVKITPKYNDDGSRTFDLSASGGSGSGSGGHFVSVTKTNSGDSDDSLKNAGNYNNDGAQGTQSTAVGVNAKAQTQGTALGNEANASNTGATAIGTGAVANGTSSVALGQNASAQNDNAVAIGHGSGAYANSVAIGGNARSTAERSVHIGAMTDTNTATGSASVSIGADAKATASGAASFGTGAEASGTDSLALGQNSSSTGNGSVAIGYQTKVTNNKEHATAVGTSAEANATEGTVLGYNAKVNGDKGVALGSGASVAAENGNKTSVALGAGSQVNNGDTVGTSSLSIKDTYGETSSSTTYNFAGTNPTGTISVGSGSGSSEQTRTITHVAAGRVNNTSTDAINGSQLYGVAQSIEKVEQNVAKTATRYYSVKATDTGTGSNYLNDGAHGNNSLAAGNKAQAYGVGSLAIGYSSLAGSASNDDTLFSSMAIGPYAKAQGTGAIAFGNSSSSSGYGGVALGGGANVSSYGGVALGGTSSATATGGVALGTGSKASTAAGLAGYLSGSKKTGQADSVWTSTIGAVSLGGGTFKTDSGEKIYTRQITNLAAGTQDTDAVNVAQLKAVEQEGFSLTGNDGSKVTQSLGGNFNITGGLTGDALKDGAASTANLGVRKNAKGDGLEVVMTTTTSFDTVTAKNGITVKNASTADGTSDISLNGNGLFMGSKKITGLVDGTADTDAVNFGQLSTVSSELSDFEKKTIQVGGNGGSTISRKLGENPILIQGAGTKDNANYSGTNLKTYVDENGVLQILLDKELLEDRIDVGSALAKPTDSRVNYPVVLGTDATDATIGYVGINGRNGTSAVITSYAGSLIPGSDFNYTDSEGKSRMTRLEYTDQEGHAHHLATLTDGLTFGGDNSQVQIDSDSGTVSGTNVISRKLRATEYGKNNTTTNYLQIKGGADANKLSDKNIGVQASSDDGSLTVKLSQELTGLTSAQFGTTTTINGSGLTLGNTGISLTSSGLKNGGQKITNVQAGDISSTSTDAIIGSQLTNILNADGSAKGISFGAESAAGSHTNPTSVAIGDTVILKGAGGDSSHKNLSTQVTDKGELTVAMASEIQENKIYVGTQISKESSPTGNVNYPVILGENTVGTDTYGYVGIKGKNNSQLYLTADKDTSNNTRLDYLDANNNAHLVALTSDGYTFAGDVGTANTLALNNTLSITGGIKDTGNLTTGNIGVVSSGNGGLTVQLAKSLTGLTDATFNSGAAQTKIDANGVTAPAYKVGTNTYIDSNGLHANGQKVTNVQNGALSADSADAVNGSQLFATNQNVTKNAGDITNLTTRLDGAGMTFAGDSGSTTVNLNGTLQVNGADSNLTVSGDTAGLKVGLSKTLTGLTSVEVSGSDFKTTLTGDGLKIIPTSGNSQTSIVFTASDGINLGNRKISGLTGGVIQADSTDAVNGGQLYTVQEAASQAQAEAKKHATVSVGDNNLVLTTTDESKTKGTDYALKLNNKITLGTGDNHVVLDGSDTGKSSFGNAIFFDAGTGAIIAGALTTSGLVTANGGVKVEDISLNPTTNTITGLNNTTFDQNNFQANRAATEGQLQSLVDQISAGTVTGGTTELTDGTNTHVSSKTENKVTTYTVNVDDNLTHMTSATFEKKNSDGNVTATSYLDADGLILGTTTDMTAARFTRSGISVGSQQIKQLGSGITGTDGKVTTYDTTVTGQADYNNAASIGDVQTILHGAQDVFAGNNGTTATLTLGKTAAFQGTDVTLTGSQTLDDVLAADYSKANLTVRTVGNNDGSVTTSLYMKQDMVGRSLTLGTIGSDGNVAESNQIASLYQTQSKAENDTAMTGHLFLSGEKRIKTAGNPSITHTSADLFVKDGTEGDKGYLKDKDLPVTRIYYTDEGNDTYALATMKDGLHVAGDSGTTSDLFLNQTLKLTGNGTAQTSYTSGNIGIYSDGNGTLDVQLADTLAGLKQISFADSAVSIGHNGINAGGKQITSVASGLPSGTALKDASDTILQNAANIGDVKNAAAAASAEVVAGNNVTVSKDTTSAKDGHTIYTVAADFKGADVSGSNAVVYDSDAKNQVTLGRGSSSATPVKLTNLADGEINSTSTDAVTGRQLNEVITTRNQTINVAGDTGSAVKLNHGNTLNISGDPNISTSSSGSDTARDGSLQVSLADNVYLKGIHIGSTYPSHSSTSVDSVALTADADNQTGILTLRGDATHVSDAYPRAQADISVLSAAPDQTYAAAPFLQEVYQTSNSGIITQNQPVRLTYRDNYNTAHQVATLDDGYVFSGDNGDKNLTEKLNGTVALRGMDNEHAAQVTSDNADSYLTKNNIGVVTKPKVLNEDGSTQGGEVEIRLAKNLTGLTSATFTNDNGDTAVIDAKNLKLTLNAQTEGKSPVSLTSNGLDNGKNKITNVADGTSDMDAVNYGQIKSIINSGDGKIKGLTFAAGDNTSATVHLGDTLKIAGATDQDGAQNIHTTVKDGTMTLQLDRKVQVDELHVGQKGSDAASLTAVLLDGNTGSMGQLHLKGMGAAQANIMTTMGTASLASTDDTTTRLTYNNGNVGNTHQIAILEDGLRFTGDNYVKASGSTPEQNVVKTQLDQTLSITGGQTDTQQLTDLTDKNIGVVAENGGLSVRLSKVLDGMTDIYMGDTRENSSHLTKNGLYLSPKSSTEYVVKFTADNGISAGSQAINDVADGVKDSDAATVGQLKNVEAKANNATKLTVNHGQSEGNLTLTDTLDKDGIHHTYDVALSDKVIVGSTGNSITLDGTANTINGGSYVKFGGDAASKTQALAIGWQSAGLKDVLTDQDKGSQTGNYLTGLSNTRWDPMNVGYSSSRAATEGQLRDLEERVWENPITFLGNHDMDKTADESEGIKAELGSKVRIIGTGTGKDADFDASNINVIAGQTPDGQSEAMIIQMKKAPNFTTVHAGTPNEQGVYPVSVGQVTVTRDGKTQTVDGLVITDGPMITKDGINNYGKQITHMKSGGIYNEEDKKYHYDSDEVGTNAATIQDVKNIANAAAQSEVEGKRVTVSGVNDNITVTTAADNPNHYQVKLSDTLKLGQDSKDNANIIIDGQKGKVTVGSGSTGNNSVIIDGNGGTVTIGNGTSGHQKVVVDGNNGTITGLTNKDWDGQNIVSGRAATEDQLKKVADSVSNLDKAASKTDFQLVGEKDKDGNYTGDYQVSDDNKVKLHVQDKMHPDQVRDITIDNVAKASDIGDVSRISEDIQNKEHNTVVDSLNKLNEKVKDAANGSWESQIDGKAVKKIKAGDVQNFTSGDNIELSNDNGAIKISTKKDVSFDKVTIGSGDSQMTLDKDGLQTGKVKVSHNEINAGGNQIHGVADGTKEDDAATFGQVKKVDDKVDKVADAAGTAINTLGNHINRLDRRINKVGAGAAALAALHPDPNSDDDLSFAAGIGNYRGSTAAALGAFYRPSDNVTVSMGATIGNGENMVNAGVTIGVGEGVGRNPSTRKAMAKEISQLKEANAAKDAEVRDLKKQVQTLQKQNEDTQEKLKRIMEKLGI